MIPVCKTCGRSVLSHFRTFRLVYCPPIQNRTDSTVVKPEMLDDGFGNQWELCRADCALQIVRPGKVQCEAEDCPHRTENPSYYP